MPLLQMFADGGGERILMTGTCAEYDWQYGYCDEELTPLAPSNPYGICKYALSQMLNSFSSSAGISSAWGRIFWVYGQYEYPNRLVPSVIRSLLAHKVAECSSGYQVRDYLYVNDVAYALVTILESDLNGAVNIGSGTPISIRQLVVQIAAYLEHPNLVEFGTIPSQTQEANLVVAKCNRLQIALNWKPKFSLIQGIENTVNFWKQKNC
jgi:nucleoside-diphosphate-sugar epimerase